MKKLVLVAFLAIFVMFSAAEVKAQDATASIIVETSAPLETVLDTDLVIADLVAASEDQTIIVLDDESIDVGEENNIDITSLASFTLTGAPDEDVAITVENDEVLLGEAGNELEFRDFTSSQATLDATTGEATISIGFRVDIPANFPAGEYQADDAIEVTSSYVD